MASCKIQNAGPAPETRENSTARRRRNLQGPFLASRINSTAKGRTYHSLKRVSVPKSAANPAPATARVRPFVGKRNEAYTARTAHMMASGSVMGVLDRYTMLGHIRNAARVTIPAAAL